MVTRRHVAGLDRVQACARDRRGERRSGAQGRRRSGFRRRLAADPATACRGCVAPPGSRRSPAHRRGDQPRDRPSDPPAPHQTVMGCATATGPRARRRTLEPSDNRQRDDGQQRRGRRRLRRADRHRGSPRRLGSERDPYSIYEPALPPEARRPRGGLPRLQRRLRQRRRSRRTSSLPTAPARHTSVVQSGYDNVGTQTEEIVATTASDIHILDSATSTSANAQPPPTVLSGFTPTGNTLSRQHAGGPRSTTLR